MSRELGVAYHHPTTGDWWQIVEWPMHIRGQPDPVLGYAVRRARSAEGPWEPPRLELHAREHAEQILEQCLTQAPID
jgi:hypothetical protein